MLTRSIFVWNFCERNEGEEEENSQILCDLPSNWMSDCSVDVAELIKWTALIRK